MTKQAILIEVQRYMQEGKLSQAVDCLERWLYEKNQDSNLDSDLAAVMTQLIHLSVRQNNYARAHELAVKLAGLRKFNWKMNFVTHYVSLIILTSFVFGLPYGIWMYIYRLLDPALKQSNQDEINGILWGVYWQDIQLAAVCNLKSLVLANTEKSKLRSIGFLAYSTSHRGYSWVGLRAIKKVIDQARREHHSDLVKEFRLWYAVACQWAGDYHLSRSIYECYEQDYPDAEAFLKIITYAGRLHLDFCEAGPIEVSESLQKCFNASFALKESRNHIQIYGAKACLLSLEGKVEEAEIFIEKSMKAKQKNANRLDSFIAHRFSCVCYLNSNQLELAKREYRKARAYLIEYGNPVGYKLELDKISVLIKLKQEDSWSRRFYYFAKVCCSHLLHLNRIRTVSLYLFGTRLLSEKNLGFWSSESILNYFKVKMDTSKLQKNEMERNLLSLKFAKAFNEISPKFDSDAQNSTDLASDIIRKAMPGVMCIYDGESLDEIYQKHCEQYEPLGTTVFNHSDERLLVPCLEDVFLIAIQSHTAQMGALGRSVAKGIAIRGLDIDSQDVIEGGLRLVLSYQSALDSIFASKKEYALSQRNAAIALAIQMIAHDVRKPFSLIQAVASLFKKSKTPQDIHHIIDRMLPQVQDSAHSVSTMLQDVVEIGKTTQLDIQINSLGEMVQRSLADIFASAHSSQILIELDFNHKFFLKVDRIKIIRVLSNILNNASQALGGVGSIRIRSHLKQHSTGTFVAFTIENDGPSIPKEDMARIFELFYTRNKSGGTGLGLAISKKIVEEHGGNISCESDESFGVRFLIELPLDSKMDPQGDHIQEQRKAMDYCLVDSSQDTQRSDTLSKENNAELCSRLIPKLRSLKRKFRVLVIDDDLIYTEAIKSLISSSDYDLEDYFDFSSALFLDPDLKNRSLDFFDLIITDIDLGRFDEDGFENVKRIRSWGWLQSFICVHSNRFLPNDSRMSLDVGADTFLPKPLMSRHLFNMIDVAISRLEVGLQNQQSLQTELPLVALVDDDPMIRSCWKMMQKDSKNYRFEVYESPSQFLKAHNNTLKKSMVLITDYYFEALGIESESSSDIKPPDSSFKNGIDFANYLRTQNPNIRLFLASNRIDFNQEDVSIFESVISKEPLDEYHLKTMLQI